MLAHAVAANGVGAGAAHGPPGVRAASATWAAAHDAGHAGSKSLSEVCELTGTTLLLHQQVAACLTGETGSHCAWPLPLSWSLRILCGSGKMQEYSAMK